MPIASAASRSRSALSTNRSATFGCNHRVVLYSSIRVLSPTPIASARRNRLRQSRADNRVFSQPFSSKLRAIASDCPRSSHRYPDGTLCRSRINGSLNRSAILSDAKPCDNLPDAAVPNCVDFFPWYRDLSAADYHEGASHCAC